MKYITVYYKKTKASKVQNFLIFYRDFITSESIDNTILSTVGDVSSAWY